MTTDKRETLSQLMDGEWQDLDPNDSVKSICNDDELKSTWSRYHIIRDVIKNEPVAFNSSLCDRISAAIDDEPSYSNVAVLGAQTKTSSDESATPATQAKPSSRWQTGLTGLGLAACVAMVTVVGLNYWQQDGFDNSAIQTASTTNDNASSVERVVAQPTIPGVVLPQVELVANTGTHWVTSGAQQRNAAVEKRLNMLLSQHIENSPTAERQGMLPYSRLVGYDTAPAE